MEDQSGACNMHRNSSDVCVSGLLRALVSRFGDQFLNYCTWCCIHQMTQDDK